MMFAQLWLIFIFYSYDFIFVVLIFLFQSSVGFQLLTETVNSITVTKQILPAGLTVRGTGLTLNREFGSLWVSRKGEV